MSDVRLGSLYHEYDPKGLRDASQALRDYAKEARGLNNKGADEALEKTADKAQKVRKAVDPLKDTIDRYKNSVSNLRQQYELGDVSQEEFIKSNKKLQAEMKDTLKVTEANSKEQAALYRALGMSVRGVQTAEGKLSKLGLSQQITVGLQSTLNAKLLAAGPAGQIAALGIGKLNAGYAQMSVLLTGGLILGLGLATGALIRMGDKAAEVADQIDKNAQKTGLSIEAYQEIAYWADQNGVKQEQLRQGLGDLNTRIGQAISGNKTYAKSFSDLGIELVDANGKTRETEEVLVDSVDALSRVREGAERTAAAGRLFGEEFSRTVQPALKGGVEGMEALRQRARDLGLVLSGDAVMSLVAYKDEMATLRQQFQTAGIEISAAFIPILKDYLIPLLQDKVVPWFQNVASWLKNMTDRFYDGGEAGDEFRAQLASLVGPVQGVANLLGGLALMAGVVGLRFMGMAASIGSALGTLSVQLQQVLPGLQDIAHTFQLFSEGRFLEAMNYPIRGNIDFGALDGAAIAEEARAAGQPYVDMAEGLREQGARMLASAFDPAAIEPFFGALEGGASTGSRVIAGLNNEAGALSSTLGGLGAKLAPVKTVQDVFDELAKKGGEAERKAQALGYTLDAQAQSVQTRIGLVNSAIDELIGMGLDATDEKIVYLAGRLEELSDKAYNLTPRKLPLPDITVSAGEARALPTPEIEAGLTGVYRRFLEVQGAQNAVTGPKVRQDYSNWERNIGLVDQASRDANAALLITLDTVRQLMATGQAVPPNLIEMLSAAGVAAGRERAVPTPQIGVSAGTAKPLAAPQIGVNVLDESASLVAKAIGEDLSRALAQASKEAELFGDKTGGIANQARLTEAALKTLLTLGFAPQGEVIGRLIADYDLYNAQLADLERQSEGQQALTDATGEYLALVGKAPTRAQAYLDSLEQLKKKYPEIAAELDGLIAKTQEYEAQTGKLKGLTDLINLGSEITDGVTDAINSLKSGDIQGVLGSLTGLGQTIGTAIGGPLVGSLVGAIGSGLQSLVGLIGSIFNRGGKARKAIEEGLRDSVFSGFSGGFMAAAKSRDRKDLERGIKEGIFQGVSDALIKSLFKTAILETGLNTLIKEFAAALVAGDQERAAAIAGQISALVPELTAIAENGLRLLEPINPYEKPKGDTGGDETAKDEGRPADYFNLPSASPQVLAAPAWVPEFGGYIKEFGGYINRLIDEGILVRAEASGPTRGRSTSGLTASSIRTA